MATVLGALLVSLGLDSSEFRTGSRRAQQEMGTLRSRMTAAGTAIKGALVGMFAGIGVETIRQMTRDGLQYASSLGEQATQLGVTTSELQRYRYIASQVGIEQAEMDQGLSRLNRTLGDLRNGAKAPADALRTLGLSTEEIARVSRMTAGDALPLLADRFKALETDAQRASVAADLFGGRMGGRFLTLLEEGSAGITSLSDAYRRLGIELSPELIAKADEAADRMAELQMVITAEQARIVAENAESLLAFESGLTTLTTRLKVGVVEIGNFFRAWSDWSDRTTAAINAFEDRMWNGFVASYDGAIAAAWGFVRSVGEATQNVIANISRMVSAIGQEITGRLNAVWEGARARIEQVKGWFFNLYDAVVGNSYIPDMVDEIGDNMRRLDEELTRPARENITATEEAFRELQQSVSSIFDRLFPEKAEVNRYMAELEKLRQAEERGIITAQQHAEARARLAAERMGYRIGELPDVELPEIDVQPVMTEEQIDAVLAGPWSEAARRLEATNVRIVESFAQMAQGALSEIDRFVKGIKSGNVLDIVSGLLGALDKIGGLMGGFNLGPFRFGGARAAGGPVMSSRSYLVGERGPEVFVPRSAGSIVPNHQLGGMGAATVRIIPSPYFDAVVDQRAGVAVATAAPTMVQAGAQTAQANLARRQSRSLRR